MTRVRATCLLAIAVALIGFVAGCGQGGTAPNTAVDNYIGALGEGDFSLACSMLTRTARASLATSAGRHVSCVAALKRCIPIYPANSSKDQVQLLYANVQTTIEGSRGMAALSGTVIARAVKRVNLVERGDNWVLASYGSGVRSCLLEAHRSRRGSVPIGS